MYKRINKTYDFEDKSVDFILKDDANPLKQISDIIPNNSKVLDIGAGNGILACILNSSHKDVLIDGVEINEYASAIAKKHYRNFYIGSFQEMKNKILQKVYSFKIHPQFIN